MNLIKLNNHRQEYLVHAGRCNPRIIGVEERKIETFFNHPDYDGRAQYFDVAVIKIDKPLEFSEYIQPICIPTEAHESAQDIENWALSTQGWSPSSKIDQDRLVLTELQIQVR